MRLFVVLQEEEWLRQAGQLQLTRSNWSYVVRFAESTKKNGRCDVTSAFDILTTTSEISLCVISRTLQNLRCCLIESGELRNIRRRKPRRNPRTGAARVINTQNGRRRRSLRQQSGSPPEVTAVRKSSRAVRRRLEPDRGVHLCPNRPQPEIVGDRGAGQAVRRWLTPSNRVLRPLSGSPPEVVPGRKTPRAVRRRLRPCRLDPLRRDSVGMVGVVARGSGSRMGRCQLGFRSRAGHRPVMAGHLSVTKAVRRRCAAGHQLVATGHLSVTGAVRRRCSVGHLSGTPPMDRAS